MHYAAQVSQAMESNHASYCRADSHGTLRPEKYVIISSASFDG